MTELNTGYQTTYDTTRSYHGYKDGRTTSFHLTIEKNGVTAFDSACCADSAQASCDAARMLISILAPYTRSRNPHPLTSAISATTTGAMSGEVRLSCPDCLETFHVYLQGGRDVYRCRCGNVFDLTKGMRAYSYTCSKCGRIHNGHTNFAGGVMHEVCQCKAETELVYNPATGTYVVSHDGDSE